VITRLLAEGAFILPFLKEQGGGVMRILIDKTEVVPAVVAGLCALFTIFSPSAAAARPLRSPEVTHTGPAREVSTFAKAGIPVATNFVNGGHEWYVWRILLKDFLTRVAFLPQPYAAW
jgi:hypothetical protein